MSLPSIIFHHRTQRVSFVSGPRNSSEMGYLWGSIRRKRTLLSILKRWSLSGLRMLGTLMTSLLLASRCGRRSSSSVRPARTSEQQAVNRRRPNKSRDILSRLKRRTHSEPGRDERRGRAGEMRSSLVILLFYWILRDRRTYPTCEKGWMMVIGRVCSWRAEFFRPLHDSLG